MQRKNNTLTSNTAYLSVAQGAEYLMPLIAIPYLLRIFGVSDYGKIAFAQAISIYFILITEFGFNWSGIRALSHIKNKANEVSALFWEIQSAKLILLFISTIALLTATYSLGHMNIYGDMLYFAILPALGTVLFPLWYLQGTDRIKEAAIMMLIARAFMLVCIFIFVNNEEDILLAAILQMGATTLAGIFAIIYITKIKILLWVFPNKDGIKKIVKESWHIFLANVSSSIYRSSNTVVLGIVAGPMYVTHYSIAEKIVKAAQELAKPINQAAYPRVSSYAATSVDKAIVFLNKLFYMVLAISIASSMLLFIFADVIINILTGVHNETMAQILQLMSFLPIIGGMNSVLGVQAMHSLGYSNIFSRFVLMAGVVNMAIIIPLVLFASTEGAVFSFISSELTLFVLLYMFHNRRGHKIISIK